MPQIHVLDQSTINQIAAGEVVDRPSSVVKELVENAIDAGANAVTVEVKEGGISLIRITDNGCGMTKDQISLAFQPHTTSKIRTAEDLLTVSSLGFRGEALSSIAAVAQVEAITKTRESLTGTCYCIEGGKEKSIEEIGAPDGTTFLVRNLFFNTPARLKFLKTPQTEGSYINDLMERMAMANPNVSLRLIHNGQTRIHTTGNGNLKDVIYMIFGRDIASNVLAAEAEGNYIQRITGYMGKPVISRGNRTFENYFINGRYIKSSLIAKAIETAYKPFMMQHRYPFTALHLTIPSEYLDVNVHPAKMELRFKEEESIFQELVKMISGILNGKEFIPEINLSEEKKKSDSKILPPAPEPFEKNRREQETEIIRRLASYGVKEQEQRENEDHPVKSIQDSRKKENKTAQVKRKPDGEYAFDFSESGTEDSGRIGKAVSVMSTKPASEPASEEEWKYTQNMAEAAVSYDAKASLQPVQPDETDRADLAVKTDTDMRADSDNTGTELEQITLFDGKLLSKEAQKNHRIIGQIFDTYWIIQFEDKMFLVDQHAAHEKVLYERTIRSMDKREYTSQQLSPPVIVSLTQGEALRMQAFMDYFHELGFEIEPFGGKEYAIRAVPDNLFGLSDPKLFLNLLDSLDEETLFSGKESDAIREKVASMSCKAAVKGNMKLSLAEAEALMDELMTLDNPYACPHGRPVIVSMSRYELEKKFKRIV